MGGSVLVEGTSIMGRFYYAFGNTDDRMEAWRRQDEMSPSWANVYKREALVAAGGFDDELSQG